MGCDVHMVIEKRGPDGWVGLWATDVVPFLGRDGEPEQIDIACRHYRRFAALAGVRGDGPSPKGMPEDASGLARMLADEAGGDGHSHTFHSLADALAIYNDPAARYQGEDPAFQYRPIHFVELLYDGDDLSDYRVVFWFDN